MFCVNKYLFICLFKSLFAAGMNNTRKELVDQDNTLRSIENQK